MKKLLAIALFLNGCAAQKDRITDDLPSHVKECACELDPKTKTEPANISWNNKSQLKKQIRYCKCALIINDFDDVENPLEYIKPGTKFFAPTKMYPWDETFKGSLKPVEDFEGNISENDPNRPKNFRDTLTPVERD